MFTKKEIYAVIIFIMFVDMELPFLGPYQKYIYIFIYIYSKWPLEHSLNRFSPPGLCLTRSKPQKLMFAQ